MPTNPIDVALRVAAVLDELGIRYLVGGSLASSISGEPRSTLDVDLVVDLDEDRIAPLIAALGSEFYADAESLRRAVRARSSANVIHLSSSVKVDLFVLGGSPIDDEQMERRLRVRVRTGPDLYLYVYTAEDILLQKLRRYRLGNEVSDRQWRDILGIVLVQDQALDLDYLRGSAETLGVADLLDRALRSTDRG